MNFIIKKTNLLYLSLLILLFNFLFFVGIDLGFSDYKNVNRLLSLLFLILYLISWGKVSLKALIFNFILIFVFIIYFVLNNNELIFNFIYLFIFFMALKDVDINDLMLKIFGIFSLGALIHILLLFFGLVENINYEISNRNRSTFGFLNVNQLAIFYFYCLVISLFILLNKYARNFKLFALLLIPLSLYFIVLSDSRTAFFCFLVYLILHIIIKFKVLAKFYSIAIVFLFSILFMVSFFLSLNSSPFVNDVLSNRPALFNIYLNDLLANNYNFFWGVDLVEGTPLDNSYILFLCCFGFIGSIFIIFIAPFLARRSSIKSTFYPLITVVLLYGVFESNLIRVELLVPLIVLYIYFFKPYSEVE